jgi:hypothetical protein
MIPDTSQVKLAVQLLQTNPSWSIVLFLLLAGAGASALYIIVKLVQNTQITQAIADRIGDKTHAQGLEKMGLTLEQIRGDQIVSNRERVELGKAVERLDSRLVTCEFDILCLARSLQKSQPYQMLQAKKEETDEQVL